MRRDVRSLGAERLAQADLANPLGHVGEHHVHDADTADQKRDPCHGERHQAEGRHRALQLVEHRLGRRDVAVALLRAAAPVRVGLGDVVLRAQV